ncbi:MAG: translocation/assembly module TamB domain-containing protein, partial [Deltaproteobacteria bacterium]|nr:translocation/assembly module TamB domain-containing protein [Deltaproteobacteria bacterium]
IRPVSSSPVPNLTQISHVQIYGSWWNLLLGYPRLKKIHLHGLETRWPPPPDFPGFLKEETDPRHPSAPKKQDAFLWPPPELPFESIEISNGRFSGHFPAGGESSETYYAEFAGYDLTVSFHQWKRADLIFQSPKSRLYLDQNQILSNSMIAGKISLKGKEIEGQDLLIQSGQINLSGSMQGSLQSEGNKISDLSLRTYWKGWADLQIMGSWLEIPNTSGKINGFAATSMTLPFYHQPERFNLKISGQAQSEDAAIDGYRLFETKTDYAIDPEKISFDATKVIIKGQKVAEGSGSIAFDNNIPFSFRVTPDALSLHDLLSVFGLDLAALDFRLNGEKLLIDGQGYPFNMTVKGDTLLRDFRLPTIAYPAMPFQHSPECRMNLELEADETQLSVSHAGGFCSSTDPGRHSGSLSAESPHEKENIELGGFFGFSVDRGLHFTVNSKQIPPPVAEYFLQSPVSGSLKARALISGAYDKVSGNIAIDAKDLSVQGIELGRFRGNFLIDGDSLTWSELSAQPGKESMIESESGGIDLSSLDLKQSSLRLHKIPGNWTRNFASTFFPDTPFESDIDLAKLRWKGSVLFPARSSGSWQISGRNLSVDGEALADRFQSSGNISGRKLIADPVTIVISDQELQASLRLTPSEEALPEGPVPEDAPFWQQAGFSPTDKVRLSFHSKAGTPSSQTFIRFPWLHTWLDQAAIRSGLTLEGMLEGSLSKPEGYYRGSLTPLTLNDCPLPPLQFSGFLSGDHLSLNTSHGGNTMEGRFSAHLKQPGIPYQWYFTFKHFDLRAFGSHYFFNDPRNFAYLSGSWAMEGELNNWWSSKGLFHVENMEVRYTHDLHGQPKTLVFRNEYPAELISGPEQWHFREQKPLILSGDLARAELGIKDGRPPEHLGLYLNATVDAGILPVLFRNVESAGGKATLKGQLAGPVDDLKLTAQLSTRDAEQGQEGLSLSVPELRPEFRNIDALIEYQEGYLHIRHLKSSKGTGTIRGGGTFRLSQDAPVRTEFALNLDQIKVTYPVPYLKSFDSILSGNLHVSGSEAPWLIAGDITVDRARSTRSFNLQEEVIHVIRADSFEQSQKEFAENPLIRLNINFAADKSISIYNSSMQLNLSSQLHLQGDEQKQVLLGQVAIEKGKFIYKREFNIQRAEISFDDMNKIDPKLDIVATSNINPYKVMVSVSGPASEPLVELQVDPPTRDDGTVISRLEAILLLTSGTLPPQDQHSAGVTGLGISEVLNVYATQIPLERLSETLGGQYIRMYPDITTDDNGSPLPRLTVPVNLYKGVEAVYRKTASTSEVSVEVPVHSNISLSGSFNEVRQQEEESNQRVREQGGSVDLQFRFPVR